ncbi:MAG: hypothetical protein R3Y29_06085 [bacterium]
MFRDINNNNTSPITDIKVILKISFIYISSILGAGFATGHELVTFFAIYNYFGVLTFLLSCMLIGVFASAVLYAITKINPISYKSLLQTIFGINLGRIIYLLNIAFMFVLFSSMLSGGGNLLASILFEDHSINLSFLLLEHIGAIIFAIIIAFILSIFNNDLLNLNNVLCPIILLGAVFIGVLNISNGFSLADVFNSSSLPSSFTNPILAFIIYSSYNLITTIAILYSFSNYRLSNNIIKYSGFLSFILIFIAGVFLLVALISNIELVNHKELPILYIISGSPILKALYEFILLVAILTTAISNGFAVLDIFYYKFKAPKYLLISVICSLGACFSMIGFANIVDVVYPIFGCLGVFQVVVILLNFIFKNY